MTKTKFKPLRITVEVTLTGDVTITEDDLNEVRWLAHRQGAFEPRAPHIDPDTVDSILNRLFNELIESKISYYDMDMDFDWSGVPWETLTNAVKGLDEAGEPLRPPEIQGQTTIDDALSEMV